MKRSKLATPGGSPRARSAPPVPIPPPRLANEYDNAVVEQLATAPLGSLEVDRFAEFLKTNEKSDDLAVAELRRAVSQIYVDAARYRAESKASKEQLKCVEAALGLLRKAGKQLDDVKPRHTRGLHGVFAIQGDDPKGVDELTDFLARSWATRLKITKIAKDLDKLIREDKAKPSAKGERKKRLRILTEGLAEWWTRTTGKSIAPYVQSRRRKRRRAVVVRRSGLFVHFAISVLFDLDHFNPTEVTSAVTNVYDWRRSKANAQNSNR